MMRIVLTGGPGAGKTAVLEVLRRRVCAHIQFVPETASILYGGGFPRNHRVGSREAAQRAIVHVQRELENVAADQPDARVLVCDRATIDAQAYWPGDPAEMWRQLGTTRVAELTRYDAVIHLRVPPPDEYNHSNPIRIESPVEAAAIDLRIEAAWADHPRRVFIDSEPDFLKKLERTISVVRDLLPADCRI